MSATGPLATIVVPTHNRAATLGATLDALEQQDCGPDAIEVVVVPNGCTDETVATLQARQSRYRLRVTEIDTPSTALARNTGVEHARAALIVFLDDDIVPAPSFVSAHLEAHDVHRGARTADSDRVVIGYLPAPLQEHGDRFAIEVRGWSEAMFDRMREPGHRFAYTDLLSGNFSMSRARFIQSGGFDVSLRCHEDHELGYRLIVAGAQFTFAERAWGTHADLTGLARACERRRQEGRADVQLVQRHPGLRSVMPWSVAGTLVDRVSHGLAFHLPVLGDYGVRMMGATLPFLDRIGALSTWRRVLRILFRYWYQRGLADAVGTRDALGRLLDAGDVPREPAAVDVDLAGGLKSALHEIDRVRPVAITVRVGPRVVTRMDALPGSERIASRHVVAVLVRDAHRAAFEALHAVGHVRLVPRAGAALDADHSH